MVSSSTPEPRVAGLLQLYQESRVLLYGFVARRVPPEDVEDVLQEILKAVVEAYGAFQGHSRPSTWLYAIARNVVCKYHERRRREESGRGTLRLAALEETFESPLEILIAAERRDRIHELLGRLRDDEREILELRFADDLSFPEIAEILDLPSGEAVRSRCRRAILAIQAMLRGRRVRSGEW